MLRLADCGTDPLVVLFFERKRNKLARSIFKGFSLESRNCGKLLGQLWFSWGLMYWDA